jgi:hypothetical protein
MTVLLLLEIDQHGELIHESPQTLNETRMTFDK